MEGTPSVVGFAEIIDILGVSRTRTAQLIAGVGFPAPIAHLRMGKVWSYSDVRAWCEQSNRKIHPIRASAV